MDQYLVVAHDGREYGPVELEGLLEWVGQGRVLKTTLVRKNGADPVPAETLPELAAALAPAPPSAVPPFPAAVALPAEFKSWAFIGQAWELVKPHWLPLGAMFLIMTAIGAVPIGRFPAGSCVFLVIGGALYVGLNRALLGLVAGRAPTVGMLFGGFDRFGQAFLVMLVTNVLIVIGTLFFIVPGIILAIMWLFVYLVMAETNLDFWPAMEASARLTEGYRWPLFCLILACIVVGILGLLACIVGIFVAYPVIYTAIALAYRFLQAKKGAQVTPDAPTA